MPLPLTGLTSNYFRVYCVTVGKIAPASHKAMQDKAFFVINRSLSEKSKNKKNKKQVKNQRYLTGLLLVALFTITLNLNAAVTAEKVWSPESRSVTPGERVQFGQYRVTTDTATSIESITVQSIGSARLVFENIVIRNGFGRVIGRSRLEQNNNLTSIVLNKTLLPDEQLFVAVEGDAGSTGINAFSIGLVATELVTSDGVISLPLSSTRYSVSSGSRQISSVTVSRIGPSASVRVGERQFLGGFTVFSDKGKIAGQIQIDLHTIGGMRDDVKNLLVVVLNASGGWFITPVTRRVEYGDMLDEYLVQENLDLSSSPVLVGIFGDIGSSFSGGGTIAVTTNPSQWQMWDTHTGRTPVLPDKNFVGPTIRVMRVQDGGKG